MVMFLVVAWLLTLGCAVEPARVTAAVPEACGAYAGLPEAVGVCVRALAATERDPDRARALCATLGEVGDRECRSSWVHARIIGVLPPPPETLLEMCTGAPDCAFAVVDEYAAPDVVAQFTRCETYTGPFVRDCVRHALQLWALSHPSEVDVTRVEAGATRYLDQFGVVMAELRYCQGRRPVAGADVATTMACPSDPVAREACALEATTQATRGAAPKCDPLPSQLRGAR